jgi:hypothetical protein
MNYREKKYVETRDIYMKILELDPANKEMQQYIKDLNKVIDAGKK